MAIAYFVNLYPKFSESFIRREILALEAAGTPIKRYSIRSGKDLIVDRADYEELTKTRVILDVGSWGLIQAIILVAIQQPFRFLQAFGLTWRMGLRGDRGLVIHLAYLAEACVMRQWFERDRIQHVHAHFGTNSTAAVMICRVLGGPSYSFTAHGPEEFDRLVGLSLTEKIKRSAFVVGVSSFGRSQLYRWSDRSDWPKIHVVHCGLDAQFLAHALTPVPDTHHFVCVGRLCEQKGPLMLLAAAAQLHQSGLDFALTFVGDGELRPDLEVLIATLGLQDKVSITGLATSQEVLAHILTARAFVLPSFGEGLPVAIMEALALGRPVISTYIAGIPELIKPGQNGWLVPAGSVDDLAAALREAIATPIEVLTQMGKNGALAVAQRHDQVTEARKLQALFAGVLAQQSARICLPESQPGLDRSSSPRTEVSP